MTLADILIPLAGSISNEKALKMREACDMQERRVEALEKRVEALSLDVAILVEGTVEAVHEAGLRTLAQRVEALEQIRISHEADYSKSASVLADRIEALDRALSAAAEDNGDLDVRVPALERASAKNTGEGHGVAGSTPAGPSRSTTMPSPASPWDAYLEVMNAGHPGVSYRDIQRLAVDAAVRAMKNTGEGASTHEGDVCSDRESAPAAPRNTPSPASSVPAPATGEVPAWIPSVEEMLELIDDGREGDLISLIAIRAPRPWGAFSGEQHDAAAEALCKDFGHSLTDSNRFRFGQAVNVVLRALGHPAPLPAPQPSVEEMAERLRVAWNAWAGYAPGVVISPSDCWLALARAAIGGGK